MKYLIYYLLALCLIFLLGLTNEHSKEIKELREGDRLRRQEIESLQADLTVHKAEIKEMTRPYTHIIPVDGGFLGVRKERTPMEIEVQKKFDELYWDPPLLIPMEKAWENQTGTK